MLFTNSLKWEQHGRNNTKPWVYCSWERSSVMCITTMKAENTGVNPLSTLVEK